MPDYDPIVTAIDNITLRVIMEALAKSLSVCTVAGPRPDLARLEQQKAAALHAYRQFTGCVCGPGLFADDIRCRYHVPEGTP